MAHTESLNDYQEDLAHLNHGLRDDDIKTEYHPNSGKEAIIQHFDDYAADEGPHTRLRPEATPWSPFATRIDFEVATLALECSMNKQQTNTLIQLICHVQQGFDQCTLKNYDDLQEMWDSAGEKSTKVCFYFLY